MIEWLKLALTVIVVGGALAAFAVWLNLLFYLALVPR